MSSHQYAPFFTTPIGELKYLKSKRSLNLIPSLSNASLLRSQQLSEHIIEAHQPVSYSFNNFTETCRAVTSIAALAGQHCQACTATQMAGQEAQVSLSLSLDTMLAYAA